MLELKMKGKKSLFKAIPVVLIIVVFFAISEKEQERILFSVDEEKFRVVGSKNQLQ